MLRSPRARPVARKVFLPNFKIAMTRNGPAHADDPYTATFRTPVQLTKADITSFLTQVYGLQMTGIRTVIKRGDLMKRAIGVRAIRNSARRPSYKKAIVQLVDPFWYPEPMSEGWFDATFSR
jgi:ribosomal protein L23